MLSRSEVQWNHNNIYTNLWDDNTKVTIEESDQIAFKISIRVNRHLYTGDDIRDIVDINFLHLSKYYRDNGILDYEEKPLEFDF